MKPTEVLRWLGMLLLGALGACMSPVVGLECRDGYERCGRACYDLESDPQHCGGCNIACGSGEVCSGGQCIAGGGDGGPGADGGPGDDASTADASMPPPLPPRCTGPGSPENCVCGIGELKCGTTCRNVGTDPNHCGDCDNSCGAGGFCIDGVCAPSCDPPLTRCGSVCVDLQSNPAHCGSCGHACESGLCVDGECLGATAGHVVAMGHDLSSNTPATRRLLGNAVFLPRGDPVRILMFDEHARDAAKAGVDTAIASMAAATGRNYTVTSTSSLAVTFLLSTADVFVIQAQDNARDSTLVKNGETWSRALDDFLRRGGVVVLLEGRGANNAGTYQILKAANLFNASGRVNIGSKALSLVAPGDAVATQVPSMYRGGSETVGFDTTEATVVVHDPETGTPVVVHIAGVR